MVCLVALFIGQDKHPSAKAYEKHFHCFACGKSGDIIQFVEDYYNIDFKQAMEKINQDFSLGLDSDCKIDYKKINRMKAEREKKRNETIKLNKKYSNLCREKHNLENKIKETNGNMTIYNWEKETDKVISLQNILMNIDNKLDRLDLLLQKR